ncbi:MAG: peptidoglycan-binding protein [Cyanobacteriota bacterium]
MTTAQDVVKFATMELGCGETSGNNVTKYGTWYYGVQDAWCAMFVSYVFDRAGMTLAMENPYGMPKGFSYCPSGVAWFKSHAPWKWIDRDSTAKVGDIVFYDWKPGTSQSDAWHVGIVVAISSTGQVTCVDGNYGSYPAKVARHKHEMGNVYGYARPPYDNVSTTENTEAAPPWPGRYFTLTSPNMQGGDILQWQQKMIEKGYRLGDTGPSEKGDDGEFGPLCYKAAKEFQAKNGLKEDGIIGPDTWTKLFQAAH